MKITSDEQLIELGFTKYDRLDIQNDSVKYFFQKKFKDDKGTKFYLECEVWDLSWINPELYNIVYEFKTQVYQKGTHQPINVEFFSTDYEEVVKFIDDMFDTNLLDYYEED